MQTLLLVNSSLMMHHREVSVVLSSPCLEIEPNPQLSDDPGGCFPLRPLPRPPSPLTNREVRPKCIKHWTQKPHWLQLQPPPTLDNSNAGFHLSSYTRDNQLPSLCHLTKRISDQSHADQGGDSSPKQGLKQQPFLSQRATQTTWLQAIT